MAGVLTIWGIDLGRCALKAIKLRAADDNVEILAYDHIEHAKILSQPDADRNELIRSALEKFLSRNDISKDEVVEYSPSLADKVARSTATHTVEEIAAEIADLIRSRCP